MTLARAILERLDAIGSLPEGELRAARQHLIDAIGVGHAAAGSEIGAPWRRHGQAVARGGPASVFGQAAGAAPAVAALVTGGLIHSLEYDDTHTGSIVHGSAVLAAAAIAAGEATGASGAQVVRAYALWYEVLIRVGLAATMGFQRRGFHLTAVGGALASAGIAAQLRGLDIAGRQAALAIALSQASGVFEFLSNGSSVKSMHPGWGAHAGLIAADLAAAGLTGPETAFEGRFGLFRVFAGDPEAADRFSGLLDDLGTVWHLEDAAYKFHPCCHYLHPFIEAAQLLAARGVTPDAIEAIEFGVPEGASAIICEPWESKCRAEGHAVRWSLPVAVAMQFIDGRVGLESFERPVSPGVHALAARSRWSVLEDSAYPARFDALIRCRMRNGSKEVQRIDDVFGNASRPPSEQDIMAKFDTNLARLTGPSEAAALRDAIRALPDSPDLARLSAAIRAASGRSEA